MSYTQQKLCGKESFKKTKVIISAKISHNFLKIMHFLNLHKITEKFLQNGFVELKQNRIHVS